MKQIKKIINDPKDVVTELLEGMVEAYHGQIKPLDSGVQALAKTQIPDGKVALLIGGGSGHEPVFHGFIGDNMADGAACGNIFAAPTPDIILEVTQAVHRGKGVLYLYGNYAGDNMNFDMAAEMADDEGIEVKTVRVWDDVASAPPDKADERRGIAGDLFMIKIAGGAAATLDSLDEVYRIAVKARDNLRSMGVAVAAGSIPETGEPTFELPDDEIEIGMGLHGEPGVSREPMLAADPLVEKMVDKILADLPFTSGDEVALLINDLGSTTMMELLIVNRKVRQILRDKGISVYDTAIGSYCTCQEMAGFSITLLKLDDELKKYYDMPASSLGYDKR
ncbi:dihydroxyacetone kinase [candidate division KSB3 bacterium]|uniref:Dihydroxyacetone kinase n=1 Tax=candidate division KSB3 bacterium TaxID=2044937 RepID=A0A9D5JTJ4_9BACT|nr:dihydroxyacetone kinase [candidate division KSB3 bacterium]MBD3323915.1 dihydroxyacetone kinase [candidate division KSB3 bacterium]